MGRWSWLNSVLKRLFRSEIHTEVCPHQKYRHKTWFMDFVPIPSMYGIFTYIRLMYYGKCRWIYHNMDGIGVYPPKHSGKPFIICELFATCRRQWFVASIITVTNIGSVQIFQVLVVQSRAIVSWIKAEYDVDGNPTVWMVLKPVVNHGDFNYQPQLVSLPEFLNHQQ